MKYCFWLIIFFPLVCFAQSTSPQEIHYTIYATLNDTAKTITAFEKILYKNNSPETLDFVWIRLYPNAYTDDRTPYSEYLLKNNDTRFYFSDKKNKGYIDQLDFQSHGNVLKVVHNSGKNDKIKVELLNPLLPGDSVEITTPFFVKLPYNFSGFGYKGNSWQLKKWYPEIAFYQNSKWDTTSFENYQHIKNTVADFDVVILSEATDNILTNGALLTRNDERNLIKQHFVLHTASDFSFAVNDTAGIENVLSENVAKEDFEKLVPAFFKYKRSVDPVKTQQDIIRQIEGIPVMGHKLLKPTLFFNLKETDKYRYLSFMPAAGFNNYDKLMVGALIHNYQLPISKFNFLLAPMYATNSKALSGIGRLGYNIWKPQQWWQFSISGAEFSIGGFQLGNGNTLFQRVQKIVPAVTYTHYAGDASPQKKWNFLLRSFLLNEDALYFSSDADGLQTVANKTQRSAIVQFQTTLRDDRALYPYQVNLTMDATKDMMRAGVTGKYFLNYDASGEGLQARLFAGKFFYLNSGANYQASLSRYYLNLSGVETSGNYGSADYTYSGYFVGRNEYDGWMSQQIMERDGFFKISTPNLYNVVGLSDNWLSALNLTADIPAKVNPFSLFPFKLPLRAFLDVGTYSGAWSENPSTGRFLYDAGLQASIFKDAVTVYFPLLYSKVYRDYYKSAGYKSYFAHTIKFSIDLSKLKPKVLNKIVPL